MGTVRQKLARPVSDSAAEHLVAKASATRLHTSAPHREGQTHPQNPAPAAIRLRILVVDDYPDAAETLAFLLRLDGHEVHVATDGLEALEKARAVNPDAVLLDIGLPEMDGFQIAARIRTIDGIRATRLIAMTGYASQACRSRAEAVGFNEFMVKPITLARLREALNASACRSDAAG